MDCRKHAINARLDNIVEGSGQFITRQGNFVPSHILPCAELLPSSTSQIRDQAGLMFHSHASVVRSVKEFDGKNKRVTGFLKQKFYFTFHMASINW